MTFSPLKFEARMIPFPCHGFIQTARRLFVVLSKNIRKFPNSTYSIYIYNFLAGQSIFSGFCLLAVAFPRNITISSGFGCPREHVPQLPWRRAWQFCRMFFFFSVEFVGRFLLIFKVSELVLIHHLIIRFLEVKIWELFAAWLHELVRSSTTQAWSYQPGLQQFLWWMLTVE